MFSAEKNPQEAINKLVQLRSSLDQLRDSIRKIPDIDRDERSQREKIEDLQNQVEIKKCFLKKFQRN